MMKLKAAAARPGCRGTCILDLLYCRLWPKFLGVLERFHQRAGSFLNQAGLHAAGIGTAEPGEQVAVAGGAEEVHRTLRERQRCGGRVGEVDRVGGRRGGQLQTTFIHRKP